MTIDLATRLASTEGDLEYITVPFNWRLLSGYRQVKQPSVPSPDGAPVATVATECPALPRSPGKHDVLYFPIIDWRFRFGQNTWIHRYRQLRDTVAEIRKSGDHPIGLVFS